MISKINFLATLGNELKNDSQLEEIIQHNYAKNNWFIPEYTQKSISNIITEFLDFDKLNQFITQYPSDRFNGNLALILAGNIPLVGFHDVLCGYIGSQKLQIKLSSKDDLLMKYVIQKLMNIDAHHEITLTERLHSIDKIIATGSSNSNRYFEYYFKKYPHLLRSNRTSIGILDGTETEEELDFLMDDIFLYFGLGCRNISKIFLPKNYPLEKIFEHSIKFSAHFMHQKYMNNFEYNRTIYLLNKVPHLSNDFFILKEDEKLFSPIAILYYEYYESKEELKQKIASQKEAIQCIIAKDFENSIPFGTSQAPSLMDFADGINTMKFILN